MPRKAKPPAPFTNTCLGWCGKKPFPAESKYERFCKKCRAKKELVERGHTVYAIHKALFTA